MKITFVSNFMNHHQLPFCNEMIKLLGNDFKFIATEKIPDERINMGYLDMNDKYDFIIKYYENKNIAKKIIDNSDVVIIGSAPKKLIKKRLINHKLTFRYSERLFRGNNKKLFLKKIYYKFLKEKMQNDNYYLLCASAFAGNDYNSLGLFTKKTLKWGYFTEVKRYDNIKDLIESKENNSIIWVARFLSLKHPEMIIEVAKKLRNDNYSFHIKMIGIGEKYDSIKKLINDNSLEKYISLLGSMSPDKVRKHMEKSEIFLFTSDKNEGWGAVLNEAMNSGCAVVASHEIGSVPYLIDNKINGLVFENGNVDDLYRKTKELLDSKKILHKIGFNAYNTMVNLWNPEIAARRIFNISKSLLSKEKYTKYEDGPCSIDRGLNDDWFIS